MHAQVEQAIVSKAKEWIADYGEEFLVELIDTYLEDAAVRLCELRRAFDAADIESLTREAHTLKSSSANVGAMKLSQLAKEIEAAGRAGDMTLVGDKVRLSEGLFTKARSALEALRAGPAEFTSQEL